MGKDFGKTLTERITCCLETHPDWPTKRIQGSIRGSTSSMIRCISTNLKKNVALSSGAVGIASTELGPEDPKRPWATSLISLSKVRSKYDIRESIIREVSRIQKGHLLPESELCPIVAGTDKNRFRRTIENCEEDFRPFRVKLRLDDGEAKWYWGRAEDVAEATHLRDM
jgi:hypothetical protein